MWAATGRPLQFKVVAPDDQGDDDFDAGDDAGDMGGGDYDTA